MLSAELKKVTRTEKKVDVKGVAPRLIVQPPKTKPNTDHSTMLYGLRDRILPAAYWGASQQCLLDDFNPELLRQVNLRPRAFSIQKIEFAQNGINLDLEALFGLALQYFLEFKGITLDKLNPELIDEFLFNCTLPKSHSAWFYLQLLQYQGLPISQKSIQTMVKMVFERRFKFVVGRELNSTYQSPEQIVDEVVKFFRYEPGLDPKLCLAMRLMTFDYYYRQNLQENGALELSQQNDKILNIDLELLFKLGFQISSYGVREVADPHHIKPTSELIDTAALLNQNQYLPHWMASPYLNKLKLLLLSVDGFRNGRLDTYRFLTRSSGGQKLMDALLHTYESEQKAIHKLKFFQADEEYSTQLDKILNLLNKLEIQFEQKLCRPDFLPLQTVRALKLAIHPNKINTVDYLHMVILQLDMAAKVLYQTDLESSTEPVENFFDTSINLLQELIQSFKNLYRRSISLEGDYVHKSRNQIIQEVSDLNILNQVFQNEARFS
ncbi:MAG: hypothetical protein OHK0017_05470 [Patescibacteria group bacterium]